MFYSPPEERKKSIPFGTIKDKPVELEIAILECKGVRERWSINGEPHTHIHIDIGEQKATTKIVTHPKNPKFYQSFKFK